MGDVVTLPRVMGRPSKARLEALEERANDARDEVAALIAEDLDHARELLALTRGAMRAVALGRSPANHLVAIEDLVHRLTFQRRSAQAALTADVDCPDGIEALGHGAAA